MDIAYFDCVSGVSGDMVLGAMVDAGLPLTRLKKELAKLTLGEYEISKRIIKGRKGKIQGSSIEVKLKAEQSPRSYEDVKKLIAHSQLSRPVQELAQKIFLRLARAEAKVHGLAVDRVHFHEVGAVDSIVDIVGSAVGLDYFNFKQIVSSPLPFTRGTIKCQHGTLPVPAPATMELIKGVPLEKSRAKGEILTPTGAAILTTIAEHFGECPLQKVTGVGYGHGDKTFEGVPGALRLLIGEGYPVVVIEANIDDMNPQYFDYVMEKVLEVGAVDVAIKPIQMKKNRPAVMLQCQSPWDRKDAVMDVILKETTTIGVRYYPVERKVLNRELKTVKTKYGSLRLKVALDEQGKVIKYLPEYEDLKRLAKSRKRPLATILQEINNYKFK